MLMLHANNIAYDCLQFTQLDMEMAFMDSEAIMKLAENLMCTIFKQVRTALAPSLELVELY